jgi:hypothetical protein
MHRSRRQRGWRFTILLICALAGVLTNGYMRDGAITTMTLTGCLVLVTSYSVGYVLLRRAFSGAVPPRHLPPWASHDAPRDEGE